MDHLLTARDGSCWLHLYLWEGTFHGYRLHGYKRQGTNHLGTLEKIISMLSKSLRVICYVFISWLCNKTHSSTASHFLQVWSHVQSPGEVCCCCDCCFVLVSFCFSSISPWPADCFSTDLKCADNAQGFLFALQGQWMRAPPREPSLYLCHPTHLNIASSDTAVWRFGHQYMNLGDT